MDTEQAYAELGLDPGASDEQLKATWRRLIATWHPDRNAAADAMRRTQLINKAYQHIRQLRDEGLEDTAPPRPMHVRKVRLTLEDAILGCTRTVRGHFTLTCPTCIGKGQRVLATACPACKGSGAIRKMALFSWMWSEDACTDCNGDGRQRAPCEPCEGSGNVSVAYRRQVRFPAGVRDGHVLHVPATRQGDVEIALELRVEIEPHPLFTLHDDGVLRCEMPVNGYAWMAERWVEVPTPDGLQQMHLNRNALVYRFGGQGFPSEPRGPRGDYMVKLVPVFPTELGPEEEALLGKLIAKSTRAAEADKTQPLGEWQRKLKGWKRSE
jgi:molecular chaperone DnaJ